MIIYYIAFLKILLGLVEVMLSARGISLSEFSKAKTCKEHFAARSSARCKAASAEAQASTASLRSDECGKRSQGSSTALEFYPTLGPCGLQPASFHTLFPLPGNPSSLALQT